MTFKKMKKCHRCHEKNPKNANYIVWNAEIKFINI